LEAGDLTYLTNGLMKLGEGLVQILSEDEKLGKGKPFLFPPKKDIGIQKNKKTPFGQEVSVI